MTQTIDLRYLRYLDTLNLADKPDTMIGVPKHLKPLLLRLGELLGEKAYYRIVLKLMQFFILNFPKGQELAVEMKNAEKLLEQIYGVNLEEWESLFSLPVHRVIEPPTDEELTEEEVSHTYCTQCGLHEGYVELTDQGDLEGAQCYVCQEITAAAFCEGCLVFVDTNEQEGNTDGISDPQHYVYCSECGTTYETVEGEENA